MRLSELSGEQKDQLRIALVFSRMEKDGGWPSWGDLADAGETVSDEDLEEEFGETRFVPDDF